jgi:ABC-type multidrug transport system fused ATPase/permease subunit
MPVVDLIKEYVTQNPGSITLYLVLLIASTIMSIVGVTRATASMYENVTKGDRVSAMKMLGIIVGLTVVISAMTYGIDYLDNRMAPRFRQFATNSVIKEIFDANKMSYLDVVPMRYRAYLKSTAQSTYQIFFTFIKTYIPNITLAVCLLAYLFYLDYRYGVVFLIGGVAASITFLANKDQIMRNTRRVEMQARSADMFTFDVLSCLNTVVCKNTLDHERENIKLVMERATQKHIEMNQSFDNLNYMLVAFLVVLAFVVMYLAIDKLRKGPAVVTAVLTALSLMATLRAKMSSISTANLNVVTEFGRYNANVLDSVQSMVKTDGTRLICEGVEGGKPCDVKISFQNVGFTYPDTTRPIIKGFTWSIGPGLNVLRAKSGCGKTTLATILMRLHDATEGDILINGIPIGDIQVENVREVIEFSNQDLKLFSRSLREICMYGTSATEAELQSVWSIFKGTFVGVDLGENVGLAGGRMSTGMKQILRLANIILGDKRVVILDEPCSGLDPINKKTALNLLKAMGSSGKTVLLITHNAEVAKIGQNVYEMKPPTHVEEEETTSEAATGEAAKAEVDIKSGKINALTKHVLGTIGYMA